MWRSLLHVIVRHDRTGNWHDLVHRQKEMINILPGTSRRSLEHEQRPTWRWRLWYKRLINGLIHEDQNNQDDGDQALSLPVSHTQTSCPIDPHWHWAWSTGTYNPRRAATSFLSLLLSDQIRQITCPCTDARGPTVKKKHLLPLTNSWRRHLHF